MIFTKEDLEAIGKLVGQKLGQRVSEFEEKLGSKLEKSFKEFEERQDENLKPIIVRLHTLEENFEAKFKRLDKKIDRQFDVLINRIEDNEESIKIHTLEIHNLKKQL